MDVVAVVELQYVMMTVVVGRTEACVGGVVWCVVLFFFCFNDTATTGIYTE